MKNTVLTPSELEKLFTYCERYFHTSHYTFEDLQENKSYEQHEHLPWVIQDITRLPDLDFKKEWCQILVEKKTINGQVIEQEFPRYIVPKFLKIISGRRNFSVAASIPFNGNFQVAMQEWMNAFPANPRLLIHELIVQPTPEENDILLANFKIFFLRYFKGILDITQSYFWDMINILNLESIRENAHANISTLISKNLDDTNIEIFEKLLPDKINRRTYIDENLFKSWTKALARLDKNWLANRSIPAFLSNYLKTSKSEADIMICLQAIQKFKSEEAIVLFQSVLDHNRKHPRIIDLCQKYLLEHNSLYRNHALLEKPVIENVCRISTILNLAPLREALSFNNNRLDKFLDKALELLRVELGVTDTITAGSLEYVQILPYNEEKKTVLYQAKNTNKFAHFQDILESLLALTEYEEVINMLDLSPLQTGNESLLRFFQHFKMKQRLEDRLKTKNKDSKKIKI